MRLSCARRLQRADAGERETPQRPVLVAQVHYAPRAQDRVLPGIVKARIESDLGFRVSGKIAERFVDAGAIVKKGDRLARLDETDFRLQVDQAEADYSSAKGALDQTQAEEQRVETLKRQGWSAAADVDKAKAAADQARGAFARAERAVTLARNAVDLYDADADADGIVSAILAEPGQVVAAGAPVMRLAHTGEIEAAVAIPETLVDRARSAPAHVEFWALPGVEMAATLRELSPNADPTTRTYLARYSLADAPGQCADGHEPDRDARRQGRECRAPADRRAVRRGQGPDASGSSTAPAAR